MEVKEILRGEGHSLYEVSGFTEKVYDIRHTVIRAIERASHDVTDLPEEGFTAVPWDCCEGMIVLVDPDKADEIFDHIRSFMEACLADPLKDEELDSNCVPQRMALMVPQSGRGPSVIIANGYTEDQFSESIFKKIKPYRTDGTAWYAILGGMADDYDPVTAVMWASTGDPDQSPYYVKPKSKIYDLLVAFMSEAIKDPEDYEGDPLWVDDYRGEDFDTLRTRVEDYRAKEILNQLR